MELAVPRIHDSLPWQEEQWSSLAARIHNGQLPHALLLTGPRGTGKQLFAEDLIMALLCMAPNAQGHACRDCRGCTLCRSGSHPDAILVTPEAEGKDIPIDAVREIKEYLALKTHYGGRKCVLITPAEQMNRSAANSLLKTLEEPPPDSVLILVTEHPATLPATIRSRCQQLHFPHPSREDALAWLESQLAPGEDAGQRLTLAGGAPLEALELDAVEAPEQYECLLGGLLRLAQRDADPVATAKQWLDLGMRRPLGWLKDCVMDLIRLGSGARPTVLMNADQGKRLQPMLKCINLKELFNFLDKVAETERLARTNVNAQMLLEDLLIHWCELCKSDRLRAD